MKSERLLSILLLLQSRGQVPASELAERLEVSVRTVMRDVEALSASGVPVYTVRGPQGGIALMPGYRTDVTGLTAQESQALFVLLSGRAHGDLGLGQALGSALRKLMAALPAAHRPAADLVRRRILIDPDRWRERPGQGQGHLEELQPAVLEDRRLRVRYRHGRDGAERTYTLDPYGLVHKVGVWYLVADHRGRPVLYRADRLLQVQVRQEPVRRRPGQELAQVWEELRSHIDRVPAPVAVLVRVRRSVLGKVVRIHEADLDPDAPVPQEDGDPAWARVRMRFRSLSAARVLLAFGTDLDVLSPQAVRSELAGQAARVADHYTRTAQPGEE